MISAEFCRFLFSILWTRCQNWPCVTFPEREPQMLPPRCQCECEYFFVLHVTHRPVKGEPWVAQCWLGFEPAPHHLHEQDCVPRISFLYYWIYNDGRKQYNIVLYFTESWYCLFLYLLTGFIESKWTMKFNDVNKKGHSLIQFALWERHIHLDAAKKLVTWYPKLA